MKIKKEEIRKSIESVNNTIGTLKGKITNSITDDARAEIEGHIAELEAAANTLRELEAAASEGEDDKSEEMRAQMREILAQIQQMQDAIKGDPKNMENNIKKIINKKEFVRDFFAAVKNSVTATDFRNAWRPKVMEYVKNDIDAGDKAYFLPAAVVNEINDMFVGRRHRLLELVDWTGLPVFKAMWETQNDMANVHTAGTQKTEQGLAFDPIEIRPSYVYKYITLDKEMERADRDSNDVLIRYITRELLDRLLTTIENYIVAGTAPFAKATEVQALVDANSNLIGDARAYTLDKDGLVAILSTSMFFNIKSMLNGLNNRLATDEDVLAYLGVDEIIFNETTFTPSTAGATWTGILYMRPRDYKLVGDRRPDEYEDFNLSYNKKEYLTEMWIGGGCIIPLNFVATYTI